MNLEKCKKNENLKLQANIIFDGLIVEAYFEFDDGDLEENEGFCNRKKADKDLNLSFDSETTIILKFNNGCIVEFSYSEWGLISKLKQEDLKEVL